MFKSIVIGIIALLATYIVYKPYRELNQLKIVYALWSSYVGYTAVMIYTQYINGEIYYNYIDFLLWLLVHSILLSIYLLLSKQTRKLNTTRQKDLYIAIIMLNPILIVLLGW